MCIDIFRETIQVSANKSFNIEVNYNNLQVLEVLEGLETQIKPTAIVSTQYEKVVVYCLLGTPGQEQEVFLGKSVDITW